MTLAYIEHYTKEDYKHWQGDWELIYGAPYAMSPSPLVSHQKVAGELYVQLKQQLKHCQKCDVLYEIDWHCYDDTIVRPDIVIVCNLKGEKIIQTPEMVIEIVSPASQKRDETIKKELYEQKGVNYYMMVYPETKKVVLYTLQNGRFGRADINRNKEVCIEVNSCHINLALAEIW